MVRLINNVGFLTVLTFLVSIMFAGLWFSEWASTDCLMFLERPIIALVLFLILISLAGLVDAFCGTSWLLWLCLLVMSLLIVLLFGYTVFALVVMNEGPDEALSERGYKEYRVGDYSHWLQKLVNSTKNWNKIKSCSSDSKVCSSLQDKYLSDTTEHLSALQYGCCKPSNHCNFTYMSPTAWNKHAGYVYSNPDCNAWDNDPNVACHNCQTCKAGLLQTVKSDWKEVAVVYVLLLLVLIVVDSAVAVGCFNFPNITEDGRSLFVIGLRSPDTIRAP